MKALFLALAMLAAHALQSDDCIAEKVAWHASGHNGPELSQTKDGK